MQQTPGKTPAEKEKYWTKIIEEARIYPAGITAYCTANGIAHSNYYKWFQKLRPSHPEWKDLSNTPQQRRSTQSRKRPSTEVMERPRRRKFNAKEKARILREIDMLPKGQAAAILRREGVYASQLQKWRAERELAALEPKKRGVKGNPLTAEVKKLQSQCAKLEKRLKQAAAIIELQKKISEILGISTEIDENNSQ